MLSNNKINDLNILATKIRIETIKQIKKRGFGHLGGAMSIADVLAVLYGEVMKIDHTNPKWEQRDWFVCSKGHAGPAVYSALALKGYFPIEELETLNQPGTNLPSHCDRLKTKGVDVTTGSLGQGFSTALGVALGNRLSGKDNYTYAIIGDGEADEGQVWETIMYAAQKKINTFISFIDYNKQQLDGYTKDVNDLGDLRKKLEDFGWYALEVDGHNVAEIYNAIEQGKSQKDKPVMIILHTMKGKGCTFTENTLNNHHIEVDNAKSDEAINVLVEKLDELVNN